MDVIDILMAKMLSGGSGGGGGGSVTSVNGKTGTVELGADDVGAMSSSSAIALLECLKNMTYDGTNGEELLLAYCRTIGLDGWVDVKYKTAIDGSTGATYAAGSNREASDFINVDGFTTISAALNDPNAPYGMWFAVRCYGSDKAFLGSADPSGTVPASRTITFAANTKYIRLMFTPDTSVAPSGDLKGVYTGHTMTVTLTDALNNTTRKTLYLSEVSDFASV